MYEHFQHLRNEGKYAIYKISAN